MAQPEKVKLYSTKLRRIRMDFRAAVFLMCILVSASFITQSKAVIGPSIESGKRYSKFSLEADEGNFNQVQCLMFVTLRNMSSIQASSSLSNAVDVVTLSFCFVLFFLFYRTHLTKDGLFEIYAWLRGTSVKEEKESDENSSQQV